MSLYEFSLDESHFAGSSERIPVLLKLLHAVKGISTSTYDMERRLFLAIPSHALSQGNHALFIITQLSFLQCEGWSLDMVRSVTDMPEIIDKSIQLLKRALREAPTYDPPVHVPELFHKFIPIIEETKRWYVNKVACLEGQEVEDDNVSIPSYDDVDTLLNSWFDFDNSFWLPTVLEAEGFGPPFPQ
jgi:hypothetical protein